MSPERLAHVRERDRRAVKARDAKNGRDARNAYMRQWYHAHKHEKGIGDKPPTVPPELRAANRNARARAAYRDGYDTKSTHLQSIPPTGVVYLIADASGLAKIGYSRNADKRLYMYLTHNPTAKIVATRPGSLRTEARLHARFRAKQHRPGGRKTEFFRLSADDLLELIVEFRSCSS